MALFRVTEAEQRQFNTHGFVLARGLFRPNEVELLSRYARADHRVSARATTRSDAQGDDHLVAQQRSGRQPLRGRRAITACRREHGPFVG